MRPQSPAASSPSSFAQGGSGSSSAAQASGPAAVSSSVSNAPSSIALHCQPRSSSVHIANRAAIKGFNDRTRPSTGTTAASAEEAPQGGLVHVDADPGQLLSAVAPARVPVGIVRALRPLVSGRPRRPAPSGRLLSRPTQIGSACQWPQ